MHPLHCDCGFYTKNPFVMSEHKNRSRNPVCLGPVCSYCGLTFLTREALNRHESLHKSLNDMGISNSDSDLTRFWPLDKTKSNLWR